MSLTLKRLYLDFLRERYRNTKSRKVKIMLIDQLCRDAEFHRKHAIRALSQIRNSQPFRAKKEHRSKAKTHLGYAEKVRADTETEVSSFATS